MISRGDIFINDLYEVSKKDLRSRINSFQLSLSPFTSSLSSFYYCNFVQIDEEIERKKQNSSEKDTKINKYKISLIEFTHYNYFLVMIL